VLLTQLDSFLESDNALGANNGPLTSFRMTECMVTVVNRLGLHARAAARLVRTAGAFCSQVRVERADRSAAADAKSILSVLMLAASRGTELRVTAEGPDEREALAAVRGLIESGFGEMSEE
jgi:phosphotransferase system HPr (HPr) family protein